MQIINLSKNIILAENIIVADTLLKRIIGLIGKKELKVSQALIIEACNSIHTFFMRFPIDILFIGGDNRIIFLKENLQPWRVSPICWKAKLVIELPFGVIQESQSAIGDTLSFRDTL